MYNNNYLYKLFYLIKIIYYINYKAICGLYDNSVHYNSFVHILLIAFCSQNSKVSQFPKTGTNSQWRNWLGWTLKKWPSTMTKMSLYFSVSTPTDLRSSVFMCLSGQVWIVSFLVYCYFTLLAWSKFKSVPKHTNILKM